MNNIDTLQRNPVFFSLGVDFFTAKVFRSSVAAELAPMGSPSGLRQLRHPDTVPLSGDVGIPSLLKLLRLKSTLATKNTGFLLSSGNIFRATAKFSFEQAKKRFLKGRNLYALAVPSANLWVRDEATRQCRRVISPPPPLLLFGCPSGTRALFGEVRSVKNFAGARRILELRNQQRGKYQ